MYILKLALRPWRSAPLSQAFSAMAVGFLLLLAGFLFWLERGLSPVVRRLQTEQVITAYLDPSVEPANEAKIVDSIRVAVGARPMDTDEGSSGNLAAASERELKPNASNDLAAASGARSSQMRIEVKSVSAEQFTADIKEHYPDLSKELTDLGTELNLIVPRYVSVSGILPAQSIEKVRAIPGVETADSSRDRYHHIVGAFKALRWVSKLLVAGLCFALLTGLIHLTRMNSYLHQEALALMRLWGAGPWTLRLPALLSGLWVGLTGGLIAATGWFTGAVWFARQVRGLSPMLNDMAMPSLQMGVGLLVIGATIGMLAGTLGGATSK